MKSLILALTIFGFSTNSIAQELKPEHYFDFWIGHWEVSWDEASGTRGQGTNTISKTLDNKVLIENFIVNSGQQKGFKGKSMSVYQPKTNTWKQAWVDNQGGYFDFTGKIENNKRIFETEAKSTNDSLMLRQRMVFYNIKKNSFTWDWESSKDNGKTWTLNWRIFYERIIQ